MPRCMSLSQGLARQQLRVPGRQQHRGHRLQLARQHAARQVLARGFLNFPDEHPYEYYFAVCDPAKVAPEHASDGRTAFVHGFTLANSEVRNRKELAAAFGEHGEITNLHLPQYQWSNNGMFSKRDRARIKRRGGLKSGFAWVQFSEASSVQAACDALTGETVAGGPLRLDATGRDSTRDAINLIDGVYQRPPPAPEGPMDLGVPEDLTVGGGVRTPVAPPTPMQEYSMEPGGGLGGEDPPEMPVPA